MNNQDYITFPFYMDGTPLQNSGNVIHPVCGMTLRSAGSMRFRWNENNPTRDKMLSNLSQKFGNGTFVPVQLDHTHIVYDIANADETAGQVGDGIITQNKKLIPTITVADCVPIYIYNPCNGVFGIVHSGWKGTGIVCDAINLACKNHGGQPSEFCVVIGPHIHDCCYIVNQERADYFAKNFTQDCIRPLEEGVKVDWNNGEGKLYRLSLKKANLACLLKLGVKESNIFISDDCTSCNEMYGSNRRETKKNGRPDMFTVQAAFVCHSRA